MPSSTKYSPDKFRWTPLRKATVIEALRDGKMSRSEVLQVYGLTAEELDTWEQLYGLNNMKALQVQRIPLQRARRGRVELEGRERPSPEIGLRRPP